MRTLSVILVLICTEKRSGEVLREDRGRSFHWQIGFLKIKSPRIQAMFLNENCV
jgi:hypothetical protein